MLRSVLFMLWRSDFQPQTTPNERGWEYVMAFLEWTPLMFFRMERCKWELSISHRVCFICRSECVTPQKHRRLSWDNTCWSYTSITQRLWLHGRKLQRPQMINGTAGRPIWWMAFGDLIDVAVISWEFKSMFSLLCVAGKGRREHLSVSDPETNSCRECVDFLWTLICQHSLRHCSEILA